MHWPYSINCKGHLLSLDQPKVMGILNITPNSFFDGGQYLSEKQWLGKVEQMLEEGATVIDIGAYSSQANATFVTEEEEIQRIVPVVQSIVSRFPKSILSVDTFRSQVADRVLDAGAHIINDISAGILDEQMMDVVAKHQAPYIMMHMRGTPQTMQTYTQYNHLMLEMIYYFSKQIAMARGKGIVDLIIDPGFGFSKTLDQNYEVLHSLELLKSLDVPILSALSRKSMIYKFLDTTPDFALNGTSVLHTISLLKGASLLRAHDVKEAVECIQLLHKVQVSYEK